MGLVLGMGNDALINIFSEAGERHCNGGSSGGEAFFAVGWGLLFDHIYSLKLRVQTESGESTLPTLLNSISESCSQPTPKQY